MIFGYLGAHAHDESVVDGDGGADGDVVCASENDDPGAIGHVV